MRIAWVCLVAAAYMAGCAGEGPSEGGAFDGERALELAGEQVALGPRFPGSEGHAQVRGWIEARLGEFGWEVSRQAFSHEGMTLMNLIASKADADGPMILLGAHFDTRPVADRDVSDPTAPVPGANDGASGVAALLELARVLPGDAYGCDVRMAFLDAEDSGALPGWDWGMGSRRMAASLVEAPAAVVILDMIGDRDLRLPRERNSTPALVESIWAAARQAGADAFVDEDGPGVIDDHTAFLERGFPAADLIDFSYPYWHTTEDTLDKISAESLAQVGRTLQTWLERTCSSGAPFPWGQQE